MGKDPKGISGQIDLSHLAGFTGGDEALLTEFLGLFQKNAGGYIQALEEAIGTSSFRAAAHKLKGTARSIGALYLGDLAANAEGADTTNVQNNAVAAIKAEFRALELFIQNHIAR